MLVGVGCAACGVWWLGAGAREGFRSAKSKRFWASDGWGEGERGEACLPSPVARDQAWQNDDEDEDEDDLCAVVDVGLEVCLCVQRLAFKGEGGRNDDAGLTLAWRGSITFDALISAAFLTLPHLTTPSQALYAQGQGREAPKLPVTPLLPLYLLPLLPSSSDLRLRQTLSRLSLHDHHGQAQAQASRPHRLV